jgi:diguanylate cyclase (GGDEF)-like protein/PAS domain S-box-containing protein
LLLKRRLIKTTISPPNSFRWLIKATGVLILSLVALLIFIRGENLRTVLYDIASPIQNSLIAGLLFFTARLTAYTRPKQAESWRLWALAFVFYALGDFYWAILEVILKVAPFPSLSDLFYSLSYIFLWLGLVRYPVDNLSAGERSLMWLDNIIVVLGTGLVYWVFLIYPMIRASGEVDFFSALLAVAYPILDMILLWTLLIFFRNRLHQSTYIPLVLMGFSLLSQIIGDSFFAHQSLNASINSNISTQLGWTVGLIFLVFAIIKQVNSALGEKNQPVPASQGKPFNSWPLYLPYIWLIISYSVLAASAPMAGNSLTLYLAIGLIFGLVILRQVLMLNDNERLFHQTAKQTTALQENETNLRRITENMYDIITQIGADGTILYSSSSLLWVLGIEPAELQGKMIFERIHPDDMDKAMTIFSQAAKDKIRPKPFEIRYEHINGEYLWMECAASMLLDSQGEFSGAILSSRDISERKRMEIELNASEQRYRLLAVNASDVIWATDMNLQMTFISPAVQKLRGYSVPQAMSQTILQSLTQESAEYALQFFAQIMMEVETQPVEPLPGASRTLELEMTRKDGSTVWTETQMSFLLDEQDKPNGVLGVTRDITERRRSEEKLRQLNADLEDRVKARTAELVAEINERQQVESALRESEERYELAARGANDGQWDWNLKTNTIYYSLRWKTMIGMEPDDLQNDPQEWFSRIHPEDLAGFKTAMDDHLKGNRSHFETEYRILHANGNERWMLCRGLAVRDAQGQAYRMAGSQTDITERKIAEERLTFDALHDSLTGLPNRALLLDRLQQRLEYGKRHMDRLFAVLFLDLDRFKVINDSLGHTAGDNFLVNVSQRLQLCVRHEDTISRLGGDEFAILLNEINELGDAFQVADRIQAQLAQGTLVGSVNRSSSTSIGITVYNGQYTEPEEMLRDADSAMYRAKALGGGRYQVFDVEMYKNAYAQLELEADLKRAVENEEWLVYYQPILSLTGGGISGLEALIRWNHPTRGMVPPADFIPIAEESGLILPIGEYVLRKALAQLKIWRNAGHSNLWVSVNISGRQFEDPNFDYTIEQMLKESGLDGNCLRLEITESVAMKDFARSITILRTLEKSGIHFSLDDFGKGYSSLGYLKHFPLKILKVDRSFVQDIGQGKKKEAIAATIISMGHSLDMEVVAEGVETQEQLAFLKAHYCNEVQGFLFSRPVPEEAISEMIKSNQFPLLPQKSAQVNSQY